MAGWWETDPTDEEQANISRPASNWWDSDPVVQEQQQAPAATQAAASDWWKSDPVEQPEPSAPAAQPEPPAEGMLATGVRAAAHAVLPTIASIPAFVAGSATPLGPVGGLAAGAAAFTGAHAVQESALKLMGFDDSQQQAVNARTNPWSATAGDLASAVVPFGAGPARLATRAIGAVAGAGLEAGSEYLRDESLDPARIGTAAGAGAVLTRPRAFADVLGTRTAQAIGRPELWHGAAGSDAAAGTAKEQPPPPQVFEPQPTNADRY